MILKTFLIYSKETFTSLKNEGYWQKEICRADTVQSDVIFRIYLNKYSDVYSHVGYCSWYTTSFTTFLAIALLISIGPPINFWNTMLSLGHILHFLIYVIFISRNENQLYLFYPPAKYWCLSLTSLYGFSICALQEKWKISQGKGQLTLFRKPGFFLSSLHLQIIAAAGYEPYNNKTKRWS